MLPKYPEDIFHLGQPKNNKVNVCIEEFSFSYEYPSLDLQPSFGQTNVSQAFQTLLRNFTNNQVK